MDNTYRKSKNIYVKMYKFSGGSANKLTFVERGRVRIRGGNTVPLYLQYFFCDISLLISISNRQVSHY